MGRCLEQPHPIGTLVPTVDGLQIAWRGDYLMLPDNFPACSRFEEGT